MMSLNGYKIKWTAVVKVTALIMTLVMLITSVPSTIALDTFRAPERLIEQVFTLHPEKGVTVTLEGMMPYKGWADAKTVKEKDALHAYDITIHYPSGAEFEPSKDSPIDVSFKSKAIEKAIKDKNTDLEVVHKQDNGKEESVEIDSAKKNKVSFEAESFSVYMIKTHTDDTVNQNPRRIYHFLSPDFSNVTDEHGTHYLAPAYEFPNKLNDMATTQAIRSGESLQEIVNPHNDNSGLFYGWFKVECDGHTEDVTDPDTHVTTPNYIYNWSSGTPEHVSFNEPITFQATEDEDIYLAPLFGRYRFLTFHQDTKGSVNENIIVSRKLIVLNDERKCTLSISDVRAPSSDPNKIIFWGWSFTHAEGCSHEGLVEVKQTVTTEGEEIPETITVEDQRIINGVQPTDEEMRHMIYDVWPVFKEARWVEFESGGNGASYRSPQFILLENDTTGFHNAPTRPGYNFDGWYYNVDNGNGTTTQQMVTDSNANIITGVTKQLTTGVKIEDGKLVITSDAEGSSANRVFRAKWTPVNEADFHVIVWRQKVTDSKFAGTEGYPDKTYDYMGYYPLDGETLRGATGVDPRTTTAYTNCEGNNKGFEDFATTRTEDFVGFHYARSTVSDDGMNHPTYEGKINPDGSTVVNVYYDRDLMTVTFHYKANQVNSNNLTEQNGYAYYETDDDFDELFGLVNGTYVPLTIHTHIRKGSYVYSYQYTQSDAEDSRMYGIVNDEYVELTRNEVKSWKKNGTVYTRVAPTTNSNGNNSQYYLDGSGFKTLVPDNSWFSSNPPYFNNNKWWRSRSLSWGITYSDEITDAYTRSTNGSTENYDGTRYTISNSALSETTSNSSSPKQYGTDDDGNIYELEYVHDYYYYTYNGVLYEGNRYTRDVDSEGYTGTRYVKANGAFVAVESSEHSADQYYGIRNCVYEQLTKHEDSLIYEYTTPENAAYTGTRYRRYHVSSNNTFKYEEVWTGLYDQKYTFYGYKFPAEYQWNEQSDGNGSTQTMLTGFTTTENNVSITDYHLYAVDKAGSAQICHLLQKLDGTYGTEDENRVIAYTSAGSKKFQFTNKFEGFTVCGYSNTLIESGSGSGFNAVSPGATNSVTLNSNSTFYIYHKRLDNLEFVFNNNHDGTVRTVHNIKFERKLSDLDSPIYDPPARAHYSFAGWYEDVTCTQEFDFNTTMPAANKMVYAKWTKERYRVKVDPNGGEFPLGGGRSTFFNVDYDELVSAYNDTRREYVEAHNGEYVYANFQYDIVSEFPGVAAKPKGLDAVYRKAFYIKKNEIIAAYNRIFTIDGVDYSYAASGMTFQEFQSCIDMNTLYNHTDGTLSYELVAWHKVRADGTVETIPFNFKNELTENTTIRASWVQHGGYSLVYNPTMVSTGITGTMARYNDPMDDDRKYADGSPVVILAEPTDLRTSGAGGHESSAEDYTFRGWRIVDEVTGEPEQPGVFYDPGETMILDANLADSQGVIHMEAYYEKRTSTVRRPDVAALTLDANSSTASVNSQGLVGDRKEYADVLNKQVKIARQINNFKVELEQYIKNFTNSDGSLLIGWNTTRDPGNYIPEYYADAVIGVNKNNASSPPSNINTLYAVWEPMVYLTLDNTRSEAITFNLEFDNYTGTVYSGAVNEMTGVLERKQFSQETFVTKNSPGNFTVTLPANTKIKLVIPEGVPDQGDPTTYTITGDYARTNTTNLFVYNSGAVDGVSVKKENNSWKLNGTTVSSSDPIHYTSSGSLEKGAQGRLVRFTQENSTVTLHLTSRYYDTTDNEWKDAVSGSGVNQNVHFLIKNGDATEEVNDATTTVKLIDDSNHTTKFGMSVAAFNDTDYKCIGWYMTDTAAPNAYSVDGHASDFGAQTISPSLAIPPEETTYYALFVPYIKGDLTLTHSQRSDSAGNAADENGIGLRVQYYTQPDKSDINYYGNAHTGSTGEASVVLHDNIIDEKNATGHLRVSVRAKPDSASTYKATYRNQVKVTARDWEEGDFGSADEGFKYAVFDAPVSERFVDSDTVKGLKEIRPVNYYSVFSRAYVIDYYYTARDGLEKKYTLTGQADSFEDFELYVIEHTPYVRTLAGDTVWDTDNMVMNEDAETGMHAILREKSDVRAKCTVTIIKSGGHTPTIKVPYGENLSEEQQQDHLAPSANDAGQVFDYWEIINTDTKKFVAKCYSKKFTYKVWNNYTITPHYNDAPTNIKQEGQSVTIDYIDTSRNPWGDAKYNADDEIDRSDVTDKVVADLDISYINNGDKILDAVDDSGNNLYKLGVMFEICGDTDDGTFTASDYESGESGMAARAQKLINNTSAKPSSTATIDGVKCYYTKISINENTVSTFNRSEFARSFTTSSVKNKVFRAYAYMLTHDNNLVLSEPHYLTLYDFANPEFAIH